MAHNKLRRDLAARLVLLDATSFDHALLTRALTALGGPVENHRPVTVCCGAPHPIGGVCLNCPLVANPAAPVASPQGDGDPGPSLTSLPTEDLAIFTDESQGFQEAQLIAEHTPFDTGCDPGDETHDPTHEHGVS